MKAAGFTVIRVGESVWSTWEPRDGEFDLDWLQPVLDGAHERGIAVILGTPTYAVPPWLQIGAPRDRRRARDTGERVPWGARQEVDYSHPAFRFHAERVIRAILERYADHPAVIGYQVDNEPGMLLFHNRGSFQRFVRPAEGAVRRRRDAQPRVGPDLLVAPARRTGRSCGRPTATRCRSTTSPGGGTRPSSTTEFIAWQAGIVREYARHDQFVTTCIAYPRPAVDDEELVERARHHRGQPVLRACRTTSTRTLELEPRHAVDDLGRGRAVPAGRPARSRRSSRGSSSPRPTRSRSAGPSFNLPPYPGQLDQAAFALVSRGAAMIEYWHWHTLPYGTETYWGGVLPHSLEPGRVYRRGRRARRRRSQAIGDALDGYEPDADVAILWSNDSRFALEFFPPLATADGQPDRASYQRIVDAFHRGVVDAGRAGAHPARRRRRTRWARPSSRRGSRCSSRRGCTSRPTPTSTSCATTPRRAATSSSASARATATRRPARGSRSLRRGCTRPRASGTTSSPTSSRERPGRRRPAPLDGIRRRAARLWADGLISDGADVLARYEHPRFSATSPRSRRTPTAPGASRSSAPCPSPALAADLVRWAVPAPVADRSSPRAAALPVTVSSGSLPDGRRAWFVFNWGWDAAGGHARGIRHRPRHRRPRSRRAPTSHSPAWSTRTFVGR